MLKLGNFDTLYHLRFQLIPRGKWHISKALTRITSRHFWHTLLLLTMLPNTRLPATTCWSMFDLMAYLRKCIYLFFSFRPLSLGQNRDRSPHCIQTSATECDLTQQLKELKKTYTAVVQSEPVRGETTDLVELPYTASQRFCPYTDSKYTSKTHSTLSQWTVTFTTPVSKSALYFSALIGKPDFNFTVSKDGRKITVQVIDPLTALFNAQNQQMSIRDVFGADLEYSVLYSRASSTGKVRQLSTKQFYLITGY